MSSFCGFHQFSFPSQLQSCPQCLSMASQPIQQAAYSGLNNSNSQYAARGNPPYQGNQNAPAQAPVYPQQTPNYHRLYDPAPPQLQRQYDPLPQPHNYQRPYDPSAPQLQRQYDPILAPHYSQRQDDPTPSPDYPQRQYDPAPSPDYSQRQYDPAQAPSYQLKPYNPVPTHGEHQGPPRRQGPNTIEPFRTSEMDMVVRRYHQLKAELDRNIELRQAQKSKVSQQQQQVSQLPDPIAAQQQVYTNPQPAQGLQQQFAPAQQPQQQQS